MVFNKSKIKSPEELLKDIEGLNISPKVLDLLQRFIKYNAAGATGAFIGWTYGSHADVDIENLSEAEIVWLAEKLKIKAMNKGFKI